MRTGISFDVTASDRERLLAHRDRPEQPAEARLARPYRAVERRWPRHRRDHAAGRGRQDRGLALAGALHASRRGRVAARQDPAIAHSAASVDEKSQIQALDRTQPGLPLKRGRCGIMTHDYKRHGTTTLFAALNVLDGRVIGRCMQRHRHQEFIRFLDAIEAEVPAGKLIHAIVDNYAVHKHPKVLQWLARHPRWTFHFTPTSASWLNAVEGFFAKLTKRRLKRGVFHSVVSLQQPINRLLLEANIDPRPFCWTKDPDKIIAAVRRGHQALDLLQ